jgi:hypothetical protein
LLDTTANCLLEPVVLALPDYSTPQLSPAKPHYTAPADSATVATAGSKKRQRRKLSSLMRGRDRGNGLEGVAACSQGREALERRRGIHEQSRRGGIERWPMGYRPAGASHVHRPPAPGTCVLAATSLRRLLHDLAPPGPTVFHPQSTRSHLASSGSSFPARVLWDDLKITSVRLHRRRFTTQPSVAAQRRTLGHADHRSSFTLKALNTHRDICATQGNCEVGVWSIFRPARLAPTTQPSAENMDPTPSPRTA